MSYDPSQWTYGAELEFGDVYRHTPLPKGCSWSTKEKSICNSNGVANDPKGEVWPWGGEINTRPTVGLEDQVVLFNELMFLLKPNINATHRCALHIHIGVPGLLEDLQGLKSVENTFHHNAEKIFDLTVPIPILDKKAFPDPGELEGARKFYRLLSGLRRRNTTPDIHKRVMASSSPKEFLEGYAPRSKGKTLFYRAPRTSVNMRRGTVEFRHFTDTTHPEEFKTALFWCEFFVKSSLFGGERDLVKEFVKEYPTRYFPPSVIYSHTREQVWFLTNHHTNKKEAVLSNLRVLKEEGRI